jgi:hypothetical protein
MRCTHAHDAWPRAAKRGGERTRRDETRIEVAAGIDNDTQTRTITTGNRTHPERSLP